MNGNGTTMATRRTRFTLLQGFAVSLALHSAVALPFIVHPQAAVEDSPALVIDLRGIVSDTQTTQQDLQELRGATQQSEEAKTEHAQLVTETGVQPAPSPTPDEQEAPAAEFAPATDDDRGTPPPPLPRSEQAQAQPEPASPEPSRSEPVSSVLDADGGARNVKGGDEERDAQTMKAARDANEDRIRDYVKGLSKSIQAHLMYPKEGRRSGMRGTTTVSFTVLTSGEIRSDSLKVVQTSGRAQLDTGALNTIRASVPFAPPPEEMTIAIGVDFGRLK